MNKKYQPSEAYKMAKAMGFIEDYIQGYEEGIEIGRKENAREIAKKMKEKRYPTQDISDMTGLSASEIKEL